MRVDLIHETILLAVLLGGPVGDLLDEAHGILGIFRRHLHEVILDLGHAVSGGLDDQIVQVLKVGVEHGRIAAAGLGEPADTHRRQGRFRHNRQSMFPSARASLTESVLRFVPSYRFLS